MNSSGFPEPDLVIQRLGDPFVEALVDAVDGARSGTAFVTRVKRHHPGDRIAAYPTAGSLAHWSHRALTLEGLESISLAAGYYWDEETRTIGEPVLSLREEKDKPVWGIALQRTAAQPTEITWTPIEPGLPEFDLSQIAIEDEEEGRA